jgi:hypothetical protein
MSLGNHAWLRSSGCWKCTMRYMLATTATHVICSRGEVGGKSELDGA